MQISCHVSVADASPLDRHSFYSHYSLGTSAWNEFAGDGKGGYPDNGRICDNNRPTHSMASRNPGSLEQFLKFTGGPTHRPVIIPGSPVPDSNIRADRFCI